MTTLVLGETLQVMERAQTEVDEEKPEGSLEGAVELSSSRGATMGRSEEEERNGVYCKR